MPKFLEEQKHPELVMKSEDLLSVLLASSLLTGAAALSLSQSKALLPDEWYDIHFLGGIDQASAAELFGALAADRSAHVIAFEVVASGGVLSFRIGVSHLCADEVLAKLRTTLSVVTSKVRGNSVSAPRTAFSIDIRPGVRQLRLEPTQTSRAVLTQLTSTASDETVILQWLLGPRRAGSAPDKTVTSEQRRVFNSKPEVPSFLCFGRIGVKAASESKERAIALRMLAALRTAEVPGLRITLSPTSASKLASASASRRFPTQLNTRELPVVVGWPIGEQLQLPGFENRRSRPIRPDDAVCTAPNLRGESGRGDGERVRILGFSGYPGDERQVILGASDALQHLHVLGPTGVGKSTLLLGLITADIAAGLGVVVVDPKGDLISDVLSRIPSHRMQDVVVLDPTDSSPIGLNVMSARRSERELVADQVLAVIHGVFKDAWGPRTQDILHASLLTLVGRAGVTLCDLPILLTNPDYRAKATTEARSDLALGTFWSWFDALSETERANATAPLMNKLRAFLLRPSMRAVLGQSSPRFDISQVFDARPKVLLVSLAKGQLGPEASQLFGSLVVAKLWQEAQKRSSISPERRRPVMAYIDEFQEYLHLPTDIGDVLAQARGYGLGLHLAHQHLGQLTSELRSGVLANARSRVCFTLSPDDARVIANGSSVLHADDFMRLGAYQAYASVMKDGQSHGFASIQTRPAGPTFSDSLLVRAASEAQYGTSADETESAIRQVMDSPVDASEPIIVDPSGSGLGRRRRS